MNCTERFIQSLRVAEQQLEADPVLGLFTPEAVLERMTHAKPLSASIENFWKEYLHNFSHVRSDFTKISENGNMAVLEWVSEGRLRDGQPIRYRGVSILECDGEMVRAFRTYYDSAAFLPLGKKLLDDVGVEESAI
jgi:ketosteroid isomerase-like protein